MQVKKVFIRKISAGKMVAFADIVFGLTKTSAGGITIKGFRLFNGDKGLWLNTPAQKNDKDGEWYPTIIFKKEDEEAQAFFAMIQEEVIAAYNGAEKTKKNDAPKKPSKTAPQKSVEEDDEPEW
jgi:DNA-binding cell septation regulator SpoVG